MKSSLLGAPNEDDGRKIFISTMFLY